MSIPELENQAQVALLNLLNNSEPFPLLDLTPFVDLIPRKIWDVTTRKERYPGYGSITTRPYLPYPSH